MRFQLKHQTAIKRDIDQIINVMCSQVSVTGVHSARDSMLNQLLGSKPTERGNLKFSSHQKY
jgi:hypothetical protein